MTYEKWLKEWFDNYVKYATKTRTCTRYAQLICGHIIPALGGIELSELTPIEIQRFVLEMLICGNIKTQKPLSANTVNCIISVVQGSLKAANVLGLCEHYVADKIVRPKITEKKIECFTAQEQKRIEQAVLSGKRKKLYGIIICLYGGLRIGELLALTWNDIDLERNFITVSKTCYDKRINGVTQKIVETPKTSASNRVIPIPKQLLPILKRLKKTSLSEYIIADGDKSVSVRSYQRSFELLLKRLKLKHKGFHALRHTFATRAIECGMDAKTLSELLGHTNANITLNRYVHSLTEHKKDMMNRLGKLLI